jgi:hypothetical protein
VNEGESRPPDTLANQWGLLRLAAKTSSQFLEDRALAVAKLAIWKNVRTKRTMRTNSLYRQPVIVRDCVLRYCNLRGLRQKPHSHVPACRSLALCSTIPTGGTLACSRLPSRWLYSSFTWPVRDKRDGYLCLRATDW